MGGGRRRCGSTWTLAKALRGAHTIRMLRGVHALSACSTRSCLYLHATAVASAAFRDAAHAQRKPRMSLHTVEHDAYALCVDRDRDDRGDALNTSHKRTGSKSGTIGMGNRRLVRRSQERCRSSGHEMEAFARPRLGPDQCVASLSIEHCVQGGIT